MSLTTVKLLLNIIVSTINSHFMTIDIKDFYFNTLMARSKYMRLKLGDLPNIVVHKYKLESKATNDGYIHVEIRRGMYGLPHADIIAQKLLKKRPNKKGYTHN